MSAQITFFILAGAAILGAVMMISRPKANHSAAFFLLTLLAIAGIYLQLRAPLLFAAQIFAVACVLFGIILLAIEIARLDVAIFAEYPWMSRAAAVLVSLALLIQIVLAILQRSLLPGERLTALLPRAPLPWALSLRELFKFLFTSHLLPFALILCLAVVVITGITSLFQKRT